MASGIYTADHGTRVTIVSPDSDWVGRCSPDGSWNVVVNTTGFGRIWKNGALRVNPSSSINIYNPDGSMSGYPSTTSAGPAVYFENYSPYRPTYDTDALAFFSRLTVQPDDIRKALYNDVFLGLKAAGLFSKLDALYLLAAGNAQAARQNLVANAYNLTASGSPVYTVDRGYTGDGAGAFLNTGFVPTTAGGQYKLDDAHFGVWSRTATPLGQVDMGARDAANVNSSFLQCYNAAGSPFHINQNTGGSTTIVGTGDAHFIASRDSAPTRKLFRNGISVLEQAAASTGMPASPFYLLALNTAGTASLFSIRELAAGSIGASFNDTEMLAFHNIIKTYLTVLGAA